MARWLGIVILVVLSLGGCWQEKAPAGEAPVKIGVILPIGGSRSATGSDLQAGVELALEIVNNESDLNLPLAAGKGLTNHGGVRLQAVYRDSYHDPVRAAKSVAELVFQEQVKALIGGFTSPEAAAVSEQAEILRIPLINGTATSPRLTQRGFNWFFRPNPDDTFFIQAYFKLLQLVEAKSPGAVPRRLALVYENSLWGASVAKLTKRLARKEGYEVTTEIAYNAQDLSLPQLVAANSRALGPDVMIVQASFDRDAMVLLQAYESQGLRPKIILALNSGWLHPGLIQALGPEGDRILSQRQWAEDISLNRPLAAAVNHLFRQRFGRDLSGNAASTFTATLVLAEALNRAAALTPKAIREALLQTDIPAEQIIMPWEGIKFDPRTGQNLFTGGFIGQFQDGEYRTVWPRGAAVNPIVWPGLKPAGQEAQP